MLQPNLDVTSLNQIYQVSKYKFHKKLIGLKLAMDSIH